jgi:glycosyltransferase involved in cell wall biosynthesis
MRIALVYDAVYPWEKGGAQKRIWELARRLADDHDVHLYGMQYWDGPSVMERDGVTYHGVCDPVDLYTDGRRSISQALYFATKVTPPLLREEFDIIDCQEFPYFPCFAAKANELLRESTLVVTWYEVWDDYWYEYLGKKGIFGKLVEQTTVKLADTIVPISEYIEEDLHEIGRTDGLEVVENGVDFDELQAIPESDTDWDVIYVGRLSEHKNVDVLLDAINLASDQIETDLSCCIIGDGPEREQLEEYATELGVADRVEFLGFVEADEDVIGNIKSASVFVLPSIREGFPNTILEANACGVPSIVVDHEENGSTAVVEDGVTGFITTVSPEAIADRIVECLTDRVLLEDLSTGAREFGRAHDWDRIVKDLEQVYSSAAKVDG